MKGLIDELGFIDPIMVQAGTDVVVDGHLRVELALREHQQTVQVMYVDLDDYESDKALLTLDPISALATADRENLDALLREVSTSDAAVMQMLSDLAESNSLDFAAPDTVLEPGDDKYKEQYGVIVMCRDEAHQERVYAELQGAGHECRIVVT